MDKGNVFTRHAGVYTFLAIVPLFLFLTSIAWGQVILNTWPGADGDCSDGECNLQAALNTASAAPGTNHEIRVAQGTYIGNFFYIPVVDHSGSLTLSGGWLRPGFISRSLDPTNTILDGNATGTVLRINTFPVSRALGDITVEGFTMRQGQSDAWSGGLFAFTNSSSALEVRHNILDNNKSSRGGGCVLLAGGLGDSGAMGSLFLHSNIIRNNVSQGYLDGVDTEPGEGGGCDIIVRGEAVISNNLVSRNRAGTSGSFPGYGGGLFVELLSGSANLVNNTITANQAYSLSGSSEGDGGGLYLMTDEDADPVSVTLSNSIIYGNFHNRFAAAKDIRIGDFNGTVTITHCNYGHKTQTIAPVEINNIQRNPLFSSRNDTLFYLTQRSPCIDSGDNEAANMPKIDLAGNPRPADGNNDGIAITNMGCYEEVVEEVSSLTFLPLLLFNDE